MQLEKVISEVVRLPSHPQILPKLQALLRDPDTDLDDIVKFLKVDVALTASILKLVNSTYYGLAAPAQGLDEAVSLLGFREVYHIASMAATKDVMNEALPFYNAKEGDLLRDSIATAQIMTAVADALRMRGADNYYTSGLLHGIGKIVINQYFEKRGLAVYSGDHGVDSTPHEVTIEEEKDLFGFDHAEAGAALLMSWNFPDDIIVPIRCQHAPEQSVSHRTIATALAFSRGMAVRFNTEESEPGEWGLVPDERVEKLGISPERTVDLLSEAYAKYAEIKNMLRA